MLGAFHLARAMSLIPQQERPDSFPPYETLRKNFGFVPGILEAVLMTAVTNFLCTLSTGLDVRQALRAQRLTAAMPRR